MDILIKPHLLSGNLTAIPSKSQAHRLLICAAFSETPSTLLCAEINEDIAATADCLTALGARIQRTADGYTVIPISKLPDSAHLYCRESGSTLRFLLPVAGALGVNTTFHMEGRLPQRPLSPLWEEMERMGCHLSRPTEDTLRCEGQLRSGEFHIDGGVSSQFISGLLLAAALLPDTSHIQIDGKLQSAPYVAMTQDVLQRFGIDTHRFFISGGKKLHAPEVIQVEGDWSNAAFFLAANAMGSHISIENLNKNSQQGDKAIGECLTKLRSFCELSAADIPDLVPILAVVAGCSHGAVFHDIQRLRLKESDRVAAIQQMLLALGATVQVTESSLTVMPAPYKGCTIDSVGDHRIAMAAAIAATVASGEVIIKGAQSVKKSYPGFWAEYRRLGGQYEQYIW